MRRQPLSRPFTMPTRRDFMKTTSLAAISAAAAAQLAFPSGVRAAASDELKIGLIGCGGRGSGAAVNALNADSNSRLVALGDAFEDRLETSLENLQQSEVGDRVEVDDENKFTGFDAYKGVIEQSDVVLLATPPFFRPMHLKAAVEAGKHVFCEKPVGVDVPSVFDVMETCRKAQDKNINVVSGLCYRYDAAKQDIIKRIHDGAIGDFTFLQTNYLTGGLWSNPRKPEWSDMEYQMRNWLYYYWLSGDHIVEQHIHSLDKILWVMNDEPPVKVTATGGRIQRVQPEYGNIYDNFTSTFEWANGLRCIAQCRQFVDCDTDVSDYAFGTKGTADIMNHRISGENEYKGRPSPINMYDAEHVVLFNAIRSGKPVNNADYMCKSTLMAIMARESAYMGKTLYWDRERAEKIQKDIQPGTVLLESKLSLAPPSYEWGPLEAAPVEVPGVEATKKRLLMHQNGKA